MATGKTNARYIRVFVDNTSGAAQDLSASVASVNGVGLQNDTTDVTAYSDGVHNFTLGHPSADIEMSGPFNNTASTGSHTVLAAIAAAPYTQDSYTVTVEFGIRAAPAAGDPTFEGEYQLVSYVVAGDGTWTATFTPASATAPAWGTK